MDLRAERIHPLLSKVEDVFDSVKKDIQAFISKI
jgi:hypothetical protein